MNSKRICLLLALLLTMTCLVSAQSALPDSVAAEPADTVTTAVDSVAAPVTPQRMQPKVTPVDIDDKKQTPVLHYYDKHGDPLDEPVMFLATLDTVTKAKSRPVYPLYNGVSVGLNFADAVMMAFKQRYASFDVAVDVSLHNWFFPVLEAGIGFADATPANLNFNYRVKPSFYAKLGLNYNFLYKSNPDYQVYLGLRAGFSHFGWEANGVTIDSSYWGESMRFDMTGMRSTAWWGEVLAGVKVKIVSHFSMGWSVRYHFPFKFSKATPSGLPAGMSADIGSKPWFVPGYGASSPVVFTFSAIWTIPAPKKESVKEAEP